MNMDNTDKKTGSGKIFTVIILIGIIIFFAWSAVQIVKLLPSAISSLASLADTVHNYKPEKYSISVTPEKSTINSSETLGVAWNTAKTNGSYIFSYECKDGVAVDISYSDKEFSSIACGSAYELGEIDRIKMKIDSEKNRVSEMAYTIAFLQKNDNSSSTSQTNTISIINQNIAELATGTTSTSTSTDNDNLPTTNDTTEPEKPVTENSKIDKPVTSAPVYIYEIPTSNPNGITDLALSNLKIGTTDKVRGFVNTEVITKNISGAMQFTVHNIGTKTSEDWTFAVTLPGNIEYVSSAQKPLKPNERAVLTIEFPAISNTNLQTIKVDVKTKHDNNTNNNHLKQTVIVLQQQIY